MAERPLELFGVALPFNVPVTLGEDSWQTMFAPGAFTRSITSRTVQALMNHRRPALIAEQRDRTLGLHQSERALHFWIRVQDRDWSGILRDGAALGLLHGASVAWDKRSACAVWYGNMRVITAATLLEVSLVTAHHRPRWPGTSAEIIRAVA